MVFAVIGAPNSGKSVLFNFLTGLYQKVANYPGCTVIQKHGKIKFAKEHFCIDLPGTYSLHHQSRDVAITTDHILNYQEKKIDRFLVVCNSTALQRSLVLVLQLKKLNIPISLILNMEDELLLSGGKIDIDYLTRELEIPVFLLSATRRWNIMSLVNHIRDCIQKDKSLSVTAPHNTFNYQGMRITEIPDIEEIENDIIRISKKANVKLIASHKLSDRLDAVFLHPLWGRVFLLMVSFVIFQAIFTWATPLMTFISTGFDLLSGFVLTILPESWISALLANGVIIGIGSVLVFLPQIVILTIAIGLMEMSGYMARATFLVDSFFQKIGLQGKIFMPLLVAHACAIPGVMATRTIRNSLDKMLAIFTVPFTSCSARLPVYTLLITAFVPDYQMLGFISIRTITLFSLYFVGSAVGIILSAIIKLIYQYIYSNHPSLYLDRVGEIPNFRIPSISSLASYSWRRIKLFLKKASTVILSISIVFWVLTNTFLSGASHDVENSLAGILGKVIHHVFAPLGLDWQSSTAILIGLTAREVFIGAVSVLYHAENTNVALSDILPMHLSFASGIALLVYYVYAPQCLATFAIILKETKNFLFTFLNFISLFFIAYGLAFLTYTILTKFNIVY